MLDCDLQHDETIMPSMFQRLLATDCDVVVASRYMESSGVGGWTKQRLFISRAATRLAGVLLPTELTDPMSGFFMIRRSVLDQDGSSFSRLLTRVEIGHIRIGSEGNGCIRSLGSGSSLSQRA